MRRKAVTVLIGEFYLITPPIYDFPPGEPGFNYDALLTAYADWEMTVDKPGVQIIDLHTPMRKVRQTHSAAFSQDREHPGDDGHRFMAQTILPALAVATTDDSPVAIKADPLFQQVDLLRRHRSSTWMNHIGYTREKTVPPQPLGDAELAAAKIREKIAELKRDQR